MDGRHFVYLHITIIIFSNLYVLFAFCRQNGIRTIDICKMFDVHVLVAWNGHTMHVLLFTTLFFYAWSQSNENPYRQRSNYLLLCKMFQFTLSMLGWFMAKCALNNGIRHTFQIQWKFFASAFDCQVQTILLITESIIIVMWLSEYNFEMKWNEMDIINTIRLITFDCTSESFMHKWPQWS